MSSLLWVLFSWLYFSSFVVCVQSAISLWCDYSLTALHEAAVNGNLELTQILLEHGAAVDVHDSEGTSRYMLLVLRNFSSECEVMLSYKLWLLSNNVNAVVVCVLDECFLFHCVTLIHTLHCESKNKIPYTVSISLLILLIDFHNSFTAGLSTKFSTKWSLHIACDCEWFWAYTLSYEECEVHVRASCGRSESCALGNGRWIQRLGEMSA